MKAIVEIDTLIYNTTLCEFNIADTFAFNPQYIIELADPDEDDEDAKCTVIIALMQKNRRAQRKLGVECLTVGFAIYHVRAARLLSGPSERI